MTLPRLCGAIVALIAAGLIALCVFAYGDMARERSLPTGGVTDGGPRDAVPSDAAASQALAERARLQDWRGASGPAPGTSAARPEGQALAGKPAGAARTDVQSPHSEPWVNQGPEDISLYRDRYYVDGITSLPDLKKGVLLQAAGREWRRFHNSELTVGGGIAVLGALALLGAFLAMRGRVRLKEGFSGQWVPRFDGYERFNHWMTAISFIMVALTGLILLYGQFFLRPLIGAPAYSSVASASVLVHIGFVLPFLIGVVTMVVLWVRQNVLTQVDLDWLKRGGGMIVANAEKVHAYRFNAGQKLIFWLVVLGAATLAASGAALMLPFFWFDISGMQLALLLHGAAGLIMIAVILGHIYIGTIGMEGAFDAMWSGEVDRNWAHEHHDLWMAGTSETMGRPQAGPSPAE